MIKNYHAYPAKLALPNSFVQNESVSGKLEFLVNLSRYERWWSKNCGKTIVLHLKCHCVFQQVARTPVIRLTFIEKVSDLNLKLNQFETQMLKLTQASKTRFPLLHWSRQ